MALRLCFRGAVAAWIFESGWRMRAFSVGVGGCTPGHPKAQLGWGDEEAKGGLHYEWKLGSQPEKEKPLEKESQIGPAITKEQRRLPRGNKTKNRKKKKRKKEERNWETFRE